MVIGGWGGLLFAIYPFFVGGLEGGLFSVWNRLRKGFEFGFAFSLAATPIREEVIVRAENQKSLQAVLLRCEGPLFFFHRAIGQTYGFVVFAFLSFLFFTRFLQSAFPVSFTRGIASYLSCNTGKGTALGLHLGGILFSLY